MEKIILVLIIIVGVYILAGAIFSIIFLWRGITVIDKGAENTGYGFRLLLFPGMVVFWPIFLFRWIKHK